MFLPWVSAVASYFGARQLLLVIFFMLGLSVFVALLRLRASLSDRLFPVVIICLGLSLLFSGTAVSEYLSGWDIHREFYIFLQVSRDGIWRTGTSFGSQYNSVLSISILPTIISAVSSFDGVSVLKFIFPTLFSVVPVVLYKIYRKILPPEAAFLSVFVFISYPGSYVEIIQLGRQEIGELLLVLLFWSFLSTKISGRQAGRVAILLLTVGVAVSHYSLAYVYLSLMAFSILFSRVSHRSAALGTLTTLCLSVVVTLIWYVSVAGGTALISVTKFLSFVARGLTEDFLAPSSRPSIVSDALGLTQIVPGPLHTLSRVTQYALVFSIILGFFVFMRKRNKDLTERKMIPLMIGSLCMLASAVILPNFARGLNLSRFYHVALLLVSPCFYLGAERLGSAFRAIPLSIFRDVRVRVSLLREGSVPAAILFSYLLFSSGWVWAVTMDNPTSPVLDWQRMANSADVNLKVQYYSIYVVAQDVAAARWVKSHVSTRSAVCADAISRNHVLTSYGERGLGPIQLPGGCDFSADYVYLSVLNTAQGIGISEDGSIWAVSRISMPLSAGNKIYSDGANVYLGSGPDEP